MESYAPIFRIISIVCFSVAGVSLLLAVFLFIKFRIISVIGDLTGKTARKSIEKMREENEKSGVKSHRPTPAAVKRGPITKPMEDYNLGVGSEETTNISQSNSYIGMATAPRENYANNETTPIQSAFKNNSTINASQNAFKNNDSSPIDGTQVNYTPQRDRQISDFNHNSVCEETTPLNMSQEQETSVLSGETQLLNKKDIQQKLNAKKIELQLKQNIILIHTEEYI